MANAGSHRFSRRGLIRAGGASAAGLTALGATGCSPFGDSSTSSSGGGTADRMNVLLIVTDSTRRDFVSAYAGADTLARTRTSTRSRARGCASTMPSRRRCRRSPSAARC